KGVLEVEHDDRSGIGVGDGVGIGIAGDENSSATLG
ncbi:hypothetical protein A2U01_0090611, partial [Trifolium medium]|nr:hypothetical protein [Trifolium medium]